jgi:hypothetical protein
MQAEVFSVHNYKPGTGENSLKDVAGHSRTTFKNRTELLERELFWVVSSVS